MELPCPGLIGAGHPLLRSAAMDSTVAATGGAGCRNGTGSSRTTGEGSALKRMGGEQRHALQERSVNKKKVLCGGVRMVGACG